MGFAELLLLAVGLSMDAFAVSVCKGLATGKVRLRHMLCVGIWFGGFQALMPTLGYLLGAAFQAYITAVDHWVAFVLLAFIGGNMIKESFSKEESCADASFGFRTMLLMALATSIDALAVGVTFALLPDVNLGLRWGASASPPSCSPAWALRWAACLGGGAAPRPSWPAALSWC